VTSIQVVATLFALIFTMCAVICAAFLICEAAIDRIRGKLSRELDLTNHTWLTGRIGHMGRWCSWYFPIIEDVEAYLLSDRKNIEQFREELWRKYGKRKLDGEPAPCPTQESGA
jgi:hypothetical protein